MVWVFVWMYMCVGECGVGVCMDVHVHVRLCSYLVRHK